MERSNLEKHLSECPLQLVECEFSQAGCKEKVPRRDLVSHVRENAQQHLLSMSLLNLTLTRELREKMEEKDQQIAELREELKRQGKEIEERDRQKVTQLQWEQEKQFKKLEQQIDCLQYSINAPGSSRHDFVLTEFSRRKAGNVKWYSDPFYSQGYKFRLYVISNGLGPGKGTHVSAFLQQLNGENDDNLQWSIVVDGQLQLLNQQGGHDHHDTFHMRFSDQYSSKHETRGHRFIAHTDLAPKYLKDDCLYFRSYIKITPK